MMMSVMGIFSSCLRRRSFALLLLVGWSQVLRIHAAFSIHQSLSCTTRWKNHHQILYSNTKLDDSSSSSTFDDEPPTTKQQSSSSNSENTKEETSFEFDRDRHLDILDSSLKQVSHGKHKGILQYLFPSDHAQKHQWDDIHMSSRYALLSHGAINGMDGPEHNYVNFGACAAFQTSRDQLLEMPACRVATPGSDQFAWSECLTNLRPDQQEGRGGEGYLEHYSGFRCSLLDQRPFYIRDGLVWNCFDEDGEYYGQAILFDRESISWMD